MTDADAIRGRVLVEESREAIVVLDDDDRVLLASRRARQAVDGLREGEPLPPDLLTGERGVIPLVVPYEAGGRRERLVYLSREGDLAAYEELRAGFTAAVSHELRTPLARLLTLLETTTLPGEDVPALVEQARGEIDQITELIDEVLFLSRARVRARAWSRSGRRRSSPSSRRRSTSSPSAPPVPASSSRLECDDDVELAIRPRMLRVVARNLAENAIRYAGPARRSRSSVERERRRRSCSSARDDGVGIEEAELPRLFERFYRADQARASRGTGLGLAIVKHIVTQAGGTVEARGARGAGSRSAASFPRRRPFTGSSPHLHHSAPRSREPRRDTGGMTTRALLTCSDVSRSLARRGWLRWRRRLVGGGGLITADGSSTVGPFTTKAAEDWKADGGGDVTVGHLRHRRRLRALLRRRDRHLERVARDRRGRGRRSARTHGVEYVELRVATDALTNVVNLENDWATCLTVEQLEHDLGARLEGHELEPGRSVVPGRGAQALRRRARTRARSTTSPTSINGEEGASRSDYSATEDDNVTVQGVSGDRRRARLLRLLVLRGELRTR